MRKLEIVTALPKYARVRDHIWIRSRTCARSAFAAPGTALLFWPWMSEAICCSAMLLGMRATIVARSAASYDRRMLACFHWSNAQSIAGLRAYSTLFSHVVTGGHDAVCYIKGDPRQVSWFTIFCIEPGEDNFTHSLTLISGEICGCVHV